MAIKLYEWDLSQKDVQVPSDNTNAREIESMDSPLKPNNF